MAESQSESYVHSYVRLFVIPWIVARQAPLSMEFSGQEYWSGLSFLSPGASSQPRDWTWVFLIAGGFFTIWATRETPWEEVLVGWFFSPSPFSHPFLMKTIPILSYADLGLVEVEELFAWEINASWEGKD